MMIIGPISSIYDFLTFGVLLWVFHASTNAPLFHTDGSWNLWRHKRWWYL
jgi:hypothetical protein